MSENYDDLTLSEPTETFGIKDARLKPVICPLLGIPCLNEGCSWFHYEFSKCILWVIAREVQDGN